MLKTLRQQPWQKTQLWGLYKTQYGSARGMQIPEEEDRPLCPDCLVRPYKSQGCLYCDNCGRKVRGRLTKARLDEMNPIVPEIWKRDSYPGA